ncbi:hypothetical protein TrCOL_g3199 [Triparma columacea]|nr:hypothetical protein TrCOL_g3199 [Triparma columacea]
MNKSPGEVTFFKLLHSELKKSTHFFSRAQAEFGIRHERVKDAAEFCAQPGALMVQDRWSQLAKALYRFYKDLLLLENYAIMTYCSFSKILKKHDKNTGFVTREAFMKNVVSTANFTNYPTVANMIKETEALFGEVTKKVMEEGKGDLHRDEKLFIDMVHKLNAQATGVQQEEMKEIGVSGGVGGAKSQEVEEGGGGEGSGIKVKEIIGGFNDNDAEDISAKLDLVRELVGAQGEKEEEKKEEGIVNKVEEEDRGIKRGMGEGEGGIYGRVGKRRNPTEAV